MCGIFGVINSPQAAEEIFLGLQNLQHRGQDGAGIVVLGDQPAHNELHIHHGLGLLDIAFPEDQFHQLTGSMGIGHTRYGTFGGQDVNHLQPFADEKLNFAVAHNGNIVNYHALADRIKEPGALKTSCDSEFFRWYFQQHLDHSQPITVKLFIESMTDLAKDVVGSYSVVGFIKGLGLFAFRDPWGLRPLMMGQRHDAENGSVCKAFASESAALTYLNFEQIESVKPGEVVVITLDGTVHRKNFARPNTHHCMFEWVYFARVESSIEDISVYQARFNLGVALAKQVKAQIAEKPDVIVPIPETSRIAAIALAETLEIPYREVLIKNSYVNRTFILESQAARLKAIGRKLYPVADAIRGKRVLLIDDSIVRGNTSTRIADMIRQCGAKATYLASTCPPIKQPCYYGIDFPSTEELVAGTHDEADIAKILGVDQVVYQTIEGLQEALNHKPICTACLDGQYPNDVSSGEQFSIYRSKQRNLVEAKASI